jgi:hypothetical protein
MQLLTLFSRDAQAAEAERVCFIYRPNEPALP